jgi:hypothetical protein
LVGSAEEFGVGTPKTFSQFEDFIAVFSGDITALYSGHVLVLWLVIGYWLYGIMDRRAIAIPQATSGEINYK